MRRLLLFASLVVASLLETQAESCSRDVFAMAKWAKDQGIEMHDSLQWKQYDPDKDGNWGLELKEPVPAGTTLMKVPRSVVLDAKTLLREFRDIDGEEKLEQALDRLGDYRIHKDGFLIFIKLLRCSKDADSKWAPWIQGLPKVEDFPQFSETEIACLPMYAKYAAQYQEDKFQAFCQAAAALGEYDESDLRWAFHAVGSRFWKTDPLNEMEEPNTELVPVGDMFNHREPPNVAITHDGDYVNFVFKGDADKNCKDLYITYGQPSNVHRFLAIFGFVPTDMPQVWSQVAYPDNPFSADISNIVFGVKDGAIPKIVWDAVLFALLQPAKGTPTPDYTREQHTKYKKFTLDVLRNHVARELAELNQLRQKIDATSGDNIDLIRQHNEFLTDVFTRVQSNLDNDDDKPWSS